MLTGGFNIFSEGRVIPSEGCWAAYIRSTAFVLEVYQYRPFDGRHSTFGRAASVHNAFEASHYIQLRAVWYLMKATY